MGWDVYETNKKQLVSDCLAELSGAGKNTVIAHKVIGNNLWISYKDTISKKAGIVLYLLKRWSKNPNGKMQWGYKVMDIDMHPYYYDCPVEYVQRVSASTLSESGQAWWYAYYEKKELADQIAGLDVGATVVYHGNPYTFNGFHSKKQILIIDVKGKHWRGDIEQVTKVYPKGYFKIGEVNA